VVISGRHFEAIEPLCDELCVVRDGRIESSCPVSALRMSSIGCQIEVDTPIIPESTMADIIGFNSVNFDRGTQMLTVTADPRQLSFERAVELLARVLGQHSISIRSIKRKVPTALH